MNQRLLIANLKNDTAILDEVSGLLSELKEAWESIRPAAQVSLQDELVEIALASAKPAEKAAAPQSAIGKQAALMYGRM